MTGECGIDGRANKELVRARTVEIVRILLDGAANIDIVDYVREKEKDPESAWHVPEGAKPLGYQAIRKYVARAEKLIGEDCQKDRSKLLTRHLAQRRRLYATAVSQGDVKAALAVLSVEAALLDLYPAKKTGAIGNDGTYPPLSVLVQTLIQHEGTKVSISQTEPQKVPLIIFEGNKDESGSPTGDDTPLIRGEKMPG